MPQMRPEELAKMIDHTLLKPEATADQIRRLCAEAREYGFASVCVNPHYVSLAAGELSGSGVKVCTVAGFPLGANRTETKLVETELALREGATEIDMVLNIGALKSGDETLVRNEMRGLAQVCHDRGALLKVILETALLTDAEKVRACELAVEAGVDFVKTSTGFGPGGATVEDVALMSRVVRPAGLGVKAAGGIRSYADALRMIEAGATRIGASAGVKIVEEARTAAGNQRK